MKTKTNRFDRGLPALLIRRGVSDRDAVESIDSIQLTVSLVESALNRAKIIGRIALVALVDPIS